MSDPSEEAVQDAPPAGASRADRRHYRGVTYDKRSGTWRVRISCLGLQHHVGRYNDQEEAAQMYDKIAYTLYGDAAITNFGVAAAAASDCRVPAHVLALRHKLNAFKWQVQQLQRASSGASPGPGAPPPPPGGPGPSRHPGPPPVAAGAAAGAPPQPILTHAPAMAPLAGMAPQQVRQVPGMQPQPPLGAPGAYPSLPGSYPSGPQQQMGWVQTYSMPQPHQQLVYIGGAPQQPLPQYPLVMGAAPPSMQPHMLPAGSSIAMQPGGAVGLQGTGTGGTSTAYYSLASPGQVVYLGTSSGGASVAASAPLLVSPFQTVAAAAAAGVGVDQGPSNLQALGGPPGIGVTSGLVSPITGIPAGTFMTITSEEGVQGQVDVLQLLQALDTRQLSGASSGSSASTQLQLSPSYWGLNPAVPGSMESIGTYQVLSTSAMQVSPITSIPLGRPGPGPASCGTAASQAGLLNTFGLLQLAEMQHQHQQQQQQQLVFNQVNPGGAQLPAEATSAGWAAPVSTTSDTSGLTAGVWPPAASSPGLMPLQDVPAQVLMLPTCSTPPAW